MFLNAGKVEKERWFTKNGKSFAACRAKQSKNVASSS